VAFLANQSGLALTVDRRSVGCVHNDRRGPTFVENSDVNLASTRYDIHDQEIAQKKHMDTLQMTSDAGAPQIAPTPRSVQIANQPARGAANKSRRRLTRVLSHILMIPCAVRQRPAAGWR